MPSGYSAPNIGAELTRAEVAALLIEPLLAKATVLEAGPRIFDSNGGVPLRIPKIDVLTLADPWRSENTLIAEADPDFGEVVLLPSTLKSLKVIHRTSNELVRHAVANISVLISGALVTRVALALDAAFLNGNGAANTILGMANWTGITTVAAAGAATVDKLHDAEGALLAANGDPSTATWFMNPRSFTSLRKQREGAGSGAYLLQPDPNVAGGYMLLGHPVFLSTQIPVNGGAGTNESFVLLADMQQVAVGRDLDVAVAVLPERYADYDQVGIRVTSRWDIAPLNAAGVVKLTAVTP